MAVIGDLNVKVTSSIGQLSSGMALAGKAISAFSNVASSSLSRITSISNRAGTSLQAASGKVSGAAGLMSSAFGGPLLGNIGKFGGGITGLVMKFGPLGAALTGVAGIGGLGALTMSSIDNIGALQDQADKLGIATDKLAGLKHAAGQAGVEGDAFTTSLAKMANGISEVSKTGKGTAADALKELGLSADALNAASPDQQFRAITEAMGGVENQSDKIRLAMDLFGKSGADTLRVMADGAQGLDDAMGDASDLGLAVSPEDAAAVEAVGDNLERAKLAFVGLGNTIAVAVSPALDYIADAVVSFGQVARTTIDFVAPIFSAWGDTMAAMFSSIGDFVSSVFGSIGVSGLTVADWLRESFITVFAAAEWAWDNVGRVAELAWVTTQFAAVQGVNDLTYFFTDVIPKTLDWFFGNWKDVFFTIFDFTSTVFINLGQNIRDTMSAIWDFITSGGTAELEFAWTPLADGFVNTVKKLPDIPDRAVTELEKQLGGRMTTLGSEMSADLFGHIEQKKLDLLGPGTMPEMPSLSPDDIDIDATGGTTSNKEPKGPEGALKGSAEAFSAIFAAMRGKDPAVKVAEDQLAEQKATLKAVVKGFTTLKDTFVPMVMGADP